MKFFNPKKLIAALIFVIISITFNSCCTDVYCIGADDMNQINFYGFAPEEVDTIVIKRFERNTNLKTVLDSSVTYNGSISGGYINNMVVLGDQYRLVADFDYRIELTGTGKAFIISDFVVRQQKCGTGFLCNNSYNALESYKVNGQLTATDGFFEIHQ